MKYLFFILLIISCVPKFVNEAPAINRQKLPITTDTQKPEYIEVQELFNVIAKRNIIESGNQYHVKEVNHLPKKIDGMTYPDLIEIRSGMSKRDQKCIYAHELGHALGHWHHGTCRLMQPNVSCGTKLENLIQEFNDKWISQNY